MRRGKDIKEREEDFYIEDGLIVFTASFLLKRGYCCQRGCRHCPYEEKTNVRKKKRG